MRSKRSCMLAMLAGMGDHVEAVRADRVADLAGDLVGFHRRRQLLLAAALVLGDLRHLLGASARRRDARAGCVTAVEMLVRTQLGHSTDTPTCEPSASSSNLSVSLSASTAAFDALYGAMLRQVVQRRHRRGVDDVAFVLQPEVRQERVHAVDHAPQVHAEHPLEVAQRQLAERQPTAADAGVVAHHVHRAEAIERPRRERLDLARTPTCRSVRRSRRHPSAASSSTAAWSGVALDVGHHDPHPLGGEPLRHPETDPRRGAGDDGDLAARAPRIRLSSRSR